MSLKKLLYWQKTSSLTHMALGKRHEKADGTINRAALLPSSTPKT